MLSESVKACLELLAIKRNHLCDLREIHKKYKDSDFFDTKKFLVWKDDKSKEEIAKFEATSSVLVDYLRTLDSDINRLEQQILVIENRLKIFLTTLPIESVKHT